MLSNNLAFYSIGGCVVSSSIMHCEWHCSMKALEPIVSGTRRGRGTNLWLYIFNETKERISWCKCNRIYVRNVQCASIGNGTWKIDLIKVKQVTFFFILFIICVSLSFVATFRKFRNTLNTRHFQLPHIQLAHLQRCNIAIILSHFIHSIKI